MKKILFFLFLSLSAFLNANEKNNKLVDLLHSFGNNGEYAQMDSVYNLIIHEDHYKQDKLYALNITLNYARFLNQKGDSERANTLLTQIRESAMALEKFPENTMAHQLQEIAAIATYEIAYGQWHAYGQWQNNQLTAARETAEEAVSQLEQVKDSVNLAEAYNLSGVIHRRLFMLDNAISLYQKALAITEDLQNYNLAAIIVSNISILYNETGKNNEAIQISRKQPVQAMDTLKLAIQKLRPEMPDGLKLLAYTQYARVSRDAGKPRQALQYYQKAMSYKNTTHNKANIANLEYLYGYMLFHDTDSLLQARNYVMKAAGFARKNPSGLLPKILLTLAEIEGRRNNGQLAYQLMLEAYQANEKLNDQYYQNRLSGFEAELDLKEKDLQIAGLNGKRAEEKAAYLIRTYTIGGILILALLLLIILVISMHKRKIAFHLKQLKLEKEIKEKEMQRQLLLTDMHKKMTERYICGLEDSHNRISKELHDGVCNDLLSVEMEMKQSDNSAITTQLKQIRENLRNLSHQLATPALSNFSLYQVLTLYTDKLKSLKTPHIQCYIEESIQQIDFPADLTQEVYRILQEIISNMLKHANAQQAYITASYEDGQVNLIVEDDGKGFSADKLSNDFLQAGLGLRSVKERCDKLQGGCDITSKEGQGTVIHFWFPA